MVRVSSSVQLTLAILKPDLVMHPVRTKAVKEIIRRTGFHVVQTDMIQWTRTEAEMFYKEHSERFFYNRLVGFMSSGPILPMILARQNAIMHWRQLMGPTKTFQAQQSSPNSIRALYGLSDTRNATHGSDSDESARREIAFFFPEFDSDGWFKANETGLCTNMERQPNLDTCQTSV